MIGYVLTNSFQVRKVEVAPMSDRPGHLRTGKRIYRAADVYPSVSAAVYAGEHALAKLRSMLEKRQAELHRRAGYLRAARAGLGQGD